MCWNEDPQKRPSFSELRAKFDAMLLAERNDEYIDLRISDDKPYYMLDTSATLAAANRLHPSPGFAAGEHGILLSQLASKECSPQPLLTPHLSPSCKSHTSSASVHFSPTMKPCLTPCCSIGKLSTDAEGRGNWERDIDRTHDNARPSSLLLPRERERREKQDRYVDEPSRVAATSLSLLDSNWSHTFAGSDGAIECTGKGNTVENCKQLACPEIKVIDEKV